MSKLEKPAVTSRPVHELIRNRWSPRSFANKPVPKDDLISVMEAARWAASCNNGQPWRWMIGTKDDPAAYEVGAVLLQCAQPALGEDGAGADHRLCAQDVRSQRQPERTLLVRPRALRTHSSRCRLQSLGLVVHQAAGIERDKARATFNVPDEFDIVIGIALGYEGDPDALPEELPGREREPRVRKPLGEIVFTGAFGTPASFAK